MDTEQHVTQLGLDNSSARLLPENTVCLSRTASVGYVVVMGRPMATSQDFVNWVCGPELDHRFLKYVLVSETEALWRFASGTTHQTIYYPEAKAFHVCLPPLPEQRAIASVLGALDDKIDLNRRMCQTLEEMARALFKSWFVDFDPVRAKMEGRDPGLPKEIADLFPSRLVDSALGPIPEGWSVTPLGEMAQIVKGLSYKGEGLAESGGLPMISLGCFAGDGLFRPEKVKRYSAEFQPRHVVRTGDLLVANTDMTQDRVILGSPLLVPSELGSTEILFTHHVFAFRFAQDWSRYSLYCYYALLQPSFRAVAAGFATGTTVLALPRDGMERFMLITPDEKLLAAFREMVLPLMGRQDCARMETATLESLRDTLLPKLISGEVRVPASLGSMQEVAS